MINLTENEKKILKRLRKWLRKPHKRYDFWFTNSSWEGGTELPTDLQFRNQYSIMPDRKLVKNWE